MTYWIWFTVGVLVFLLLCSATRAYIRIGRHQRRLGNHGNVKAYADLPHAAASLPIPPPKGIDEAFASTYQGKVYFFDSIEHRDMFEANSHRPVPLDSITVSSVERNGRSIERSGTRHDSRQ
jgi:hypothetical protein